MSWKLIDRPKTQKVTKALAKTFAEMESAPHDRPLSERRLQVYQKLLTAGQFRPVTWASAICKETGEIYRVNGKHTSTMLSGMEKMPEFYVTIEEYECDGLDDVARLYATFDSKMMSRTASDINMSFAATITELAGIRSRIINAVVGGVAYVQWGEDVWSHQPAERAELLLDNSGFAVWVDGLLSAGERGKGASRSYMCRLPVAAAMYSSFQKAKGAATKFWEQVRDETGEKPDLPDRKLAKFLSVTASSKAGDRAKSARKADTRQIYVKCLHAWNAWRKGETTNLNYYASAKIPTVQ